MHTYLWFFAYTEFHNRIYVKCKWIAIAMVWAFLMCSDCILLGSFGFVLFMAFRG